jgi:GT2 family glycosyltransferase
VQQVSLAATGAAPAAKAPARLEMEDGNITAQLSSIRGLEHWAAPDVVTASTVTRGAPAEPTSGSRWSWSRAGLGTVEVAICFYNAADETLACLRSLNGSSTVPHTVRIINDGSDEDSRQRVLAYIADKPWMTLVDNGANRGYTASANRAVLESEADWVVLLNSDTEVFAGWIEGLLDVVAAHPGVSFVGPVSNAATYQSVPDLYDATGKWAVNEVPADWTAGEVAALVADVATRSFPQVPLLNGFCTLIRRDSFAALGGLDERAFPAGYGEENDLWLRAGKAGHELRVADHVYVYHAKSASFGNARRAELSAAGDRAVRSLHGDVDITALGRAFLGNPALSTLREAVRAGLTSRPAKRRA